MLKATLSSGATASRCTHNFEAPTPGVVALFGRSGCGKTTLVNIISGLLEPDEGRVELDGTVLDRHPRGDRSR